MGSIIILLVPFSGENSFQFLSMLHTTAMVKFQSRFNLMPISPNRSFLQFAYMPDAAQC